MENQIKLQIISPEKIIFSENVKMVTIPSYEGDMSILKDHIPIVTFLRPGKINIQKSDDSVEEHFVQDGTIEFFKNNLSILSASTINVKNLSKDFLDTLNQSIEKELLKNDISDHDRYVLNYKLDTIKNINV